ncbi:homologous recombination OB-fold protein [Periophthalmus magnuspinnatus]|uniref:homologous recombination OB-fold protein n=1 Tax=Periophthalmus magnuspinnatus TaxID=409849 RepID=UPI002436D5CF|nr:homologous recombination OB-fold protein [Periophthalmus magnuspinnatus]
MACKMNSLFSIGEDFDDEDILGTDWGTHSSSPLPVEGAAAVSSSSLRASSVTHLEPEKNCPREIGASSVAQPKGSTSRNNSQTTAGQTVALSLRQLSTSSSLSSLDYTQTNLPVQQTTAKTELRKPSVSQDDFDDWDIDLADLEEADHQLGQPVKSTTPVSTVTALSSAKVLRPLSAAVPQTSGVLRQISQSGSGLTSTNQAITKGLRNISNHISISSNHNIQKITLPSGISKLSRFAFSANQAPPGSTSERPSAASSIPYPSTTIPSPHPQSVVPQSPGVFPGLTAASPCLRRGPEQMRQPLSTPVSSKHNRGLFESISPAAPPRPLTPSSLHTPVLTNRLVQLVSASNSKKRPRSESNRRRTRRFPGPAGLLPQQPQGQSLDDIVVSVPSTPAHGAVARSPSQCSSSQTEEEDFSGPAWTSMKTEMGLDERNPSCFLHTYSVVMVLRKAALKQLVKNKVPNMAVLLKSLVPTHTDAKAVFKDPTGEMQGTVHRRLLEDRAGDLKPGAVLLLKQVGVFSPSHRNHYLNVTPNNLLRVYSPDGACMSCTQLPPLAMEPVLLSSTPHVLREPVSKMQLLFDEDDDEGHDQEGAAQRSTENQEAVNQSAKQQTPAVAEQDSGWGADDLDELLGELPEDLYSV